MTERQQIIYDKYGGRCAWCGTKIHPNEMRTTNYTPQKMIGRKHIERSDFDSIDNKFPSCKICSRAKGQMTIDEFRSHMRSLNRKLRHSPNFVLARQHGLVKVELFDKFYFEKI